MAMARRAYYARIRSQPSLRSCCSRVSVRETFSLPGVTCFLPMSYLSHLFAPATAHRFAAWRPFSFRLTIVGAHTQSPARERLRKKQRLPCDFPVPYPKGKRRAAKSLRTLRRAPRVCAPCAFAVPPRVHRVLRDRVRRSTRLSTDLPGSLRDRAPAYRISRIRIRERRSREHATLKE